MSRIVGSFAGSEAGPDISSDEQGEVQAMDAGRRELVTGRELSPIARLTGCPHSHYWQSASGDADYVYDDLGVFAVSCKIWQHEVFIMRKVWVKVRYV